jgi:hypothetical protein
MPRRPPKRHKVKSGRTDPAVDAHERPKDFLTAAELAALLEPAKVGRQAAATTCSCLVLATLGRCCDPLG